MSKQHPKADETPAEAADAMEKPAEPQRAQVYTALTNISTGNKVYKAGEELNPDDFDNFTRLLEIGAVKVE